MDIRKVPKDDNGVWDMICEGRVKGCFQIESHLGKIWCKKVKPRKIRELSDVIAIIRPGTLNAVLDGKNMAQHYVDRKFGKEEIPSLHPLIDSILEPTYGIIVYQEQIISIAKALARFNGREADSLRKNIGKKNAKGLAALKDKFINGCVNNGVDKELAEKIFSNIEASNRYSFNASHGVVYAVRSYWSAYLKHHYPLIYFKHWLRNAEDKQETDLEVKQLIMAAKAEEIEVKGPTITKLVENFFVDNNVIYFGICNVKNVGVAQLEKLKSLEIDKCKTWLDALVKLQYVNKKSVQNLITVGAFSCFGISRSQMLHEFNCINEKGLSDKEMLWLEKNYTDKPLVENLYDLIMLKGCISRREPKVLDLIRKIETPGRELSDNPVTYAKAEENLLGVHVSHNELAACADAGMADTTCKEVNMGKKGKVLLAGVIKETKYHKTKKGEEMAFLSIEDESGELENIVVFPKLYDKKHDIIYEDSTVLISGETQTKNDSSSFIVENMYSI